MGVVIQLFAIPSLPQDLGTPARWFWVSGPEGWMPAPPPLQGTPPIHGECLGEFWAPEVVQTETVLQHGVGVSEGAGAELFLGLFCSGFFFFFFLPRTGKLRT